MKRKNAAFLVCLMFISAFMLCGCTSEDDSAGGDSALSQDMQLIYEETISPNEAYVENEDDIVRYTVKVYQDADNAILVDSTSNAEFFEPVQYEIDCDKEITKDDIRIDWTTAMGNPEPTKEDQLSIATVSISENGKLISERKISFINGGVEIIKEALQDQ